MAECWNKTRSSSLKPDTAGSLQLWSREQSCTFTETVSNSASPGLRQRRRCSDVLIDRYDWYVYLCLSLCDEASHFDTCKKRSRERRWGPIVVTLKLWWVLVQLWFPCLCVSTTHVNRKCTNCQLHVLTVVLKAQWFWGHLNQKKFTRQIIQNLI